MALTKTLLTAGALALGMATSAAAVTIPSVPSVSFTPNVNNAFTFTFDWSDMTDDGTEIVPIAFDFDLTIESSSKTNAIIGFFVEDPNGNRLEDSTSTTCSTNTGATEQCNLLFLAESTPKALFSGLAAGSYTFGIFGDASPFAGSLTFGVTKVSEVPLPAGGVLLLSALGGFAAMRRRKS